MTTNPTLDSLLERVRQATGNVDAVTAAGWANNFSPWKTESPEWCLLVRALGGNLNSAVALVERVRPQQCGVISFGGMWSRVDFIGAAGVVLHETARTAPLALLAALFASLQEDQPHV